MKVKDILLLLFVTLSWGSFFTINKLALNDIPPIFLSFIRFFLVFLFTFPFLFSENIPKFEAFKISMVLVLNIILLNYSMHISSNIGIIVMINELVAPISVLLGIIFFKEKLKFYQYIGIIFAFIGIIFVTQIPKQNDTSTLVYIFAFSATGLFAIYNLMTKKISHSNFFGFLSWLSLFSFPQFLLISFSFEEIPHIHEISNTSLLAILYLVLVCTLLSYYVWFKLLNNYSLSRIAPYLHLSPIFGLASTIIFLEEQLHVSFFVGSAIVIASLTLIEVGALYDKNRL